VLTVFALPKPFVGSTADIQRTAVESWLALGRGVQVVLVGDESGIAEAAHELGTEHVARVSRNESGTPMLDDAFARVDEVSRHRWRCYVNADVLLDEDIFDALERVLARMPSFMLVGQTRDLEAELVSADLEHRRLVALERGALRGVAALDWFVFPVGYVDPLPPFAVGRAGFDNWLVWKGRQSGPVVDCTAAVVAIHQAHGYDHVAGGKQAAYYGREAARNVELAGGRSRIYTLHDASHVLRADGSIRRNPGAVLRWRENARKVAWKLGRR
jgi:hypothetical protein